MEFTFTHDPDIFLREFRGIKPHIYDVPDDFVIRLDGTLYEPIDDNLWILCAGRGHTTRHFTLAQIYGVLLKSESCNHIWNLFKQSIFSISRESKIEEICSKKPGLYLAPDDLIIMRTNRQVSIGGYSYKLISKELQSECYRLYALGRDGQQLRFAEIYAYLSIRGGFPKSLLLGMSFTMRRWLENHEFSITEEGLLTRLALQLGQPVKTQGIANLVKGPVLINEYRMTGLSLHGGDENWYAKCEMLHPPHRWQQPMGTLQELVDALC